jgi:hypothetical protein
MIPMRFSKSFFYRTFALLLLIFTSVLAQAQLVVTPNSNAAFLVNQLIGPGISVSNATIVSVPDASGTFTATASNLGLPAGVLLTSGDAVNAVGPNISTGISTNHGGAGDSQLDALTAPFLTEDACILEFDMIATCDTIQISYVFGSDEYDEWVCTSFTDAFAFFISGPGIVGSQNIAVLPGTGTAVAINTVNQGVGSNAFPPYPANCNPTNGVYFVTNNGGATVEYDGFTVPLIAKSAVIPCSTYHIKLVVADAGDDALDSGVFLEQGGIRCASSFFTVSSGLNSPVPTSTQAVEGCVDGIFTFHRDGDSTFALNMFYTVAGTSTNGVDFAALPGMITFPPLSSTVSLTVSAFSDALTEGTETLLIILNDTVCSTVFSDTAMIVIRDQLDVTAGPDQTICQNAQVQIGGPALPNVTYSWSPTTGLNNPNISNPTFSQSGLGNITFIVTATDTNLCTATDTMELAITAPPTSTFTAPASLCTNTAGTITYTGSGGSNSTYIWSFPGSTTVTGSGAGPYQVSYATPGNYQILCQVGAGLCIAPAETLNLVVTSKPDLTLNPSNPTCFLRPDGEITSSIQNGVPGFTYLWSNGATTANLFNALAGAYSVTVTDAGGCRDTAAVLLTQPSALTNNFTFSPIQCNGATGLITAHPGGGTGSYTYLWSNGATTQSVTPTFGTYTVTITDANSGLAPCTITGSVTLTQPTALLNSVIPTIASCGQNNGTATATASGGTPPYSYVWSNGGVGSAISGLSPGNYSVTVTDAHACNIVTNTTILQTPLPTVSTTPAASFCEGEGGVMVQAFGASGTPPFAYTWSCATPPCGLDSLFDNDPIANPTSSQWYYVQITDFNGCLSNVDSVFVTVLPKPIVNAGADILLCGDSAPCQILNPVITHAAGPYTYQWMPSTGLNNATIANPCTRPDSTTIYALVVSAGNGCTSDYTTTDTLASVVVNVNPIPVADAGPDLHICLHDSAEMHALGFGAGPIYNFQWSPTTGLASFTDPNPIASPPSTTVYTLVVVSNNCPSYGDSVRVNVHTLPTVDAGWDREICLGDQVVVDAFASGDSTANYSFVWTPPLGIIGSNQVEDPTLAPVSTTVYHVEAISNYGCGSALDSMKLTLIPTPVADAGPNLFICKGDSIELQSAFGYTTTLPAPANEVFLNWTPKIAMDDSTIVQPTVWPEVTTVYYMDVFHRYCHTHDSVIVTVGPEVHALAATDTNVICANESVHLGSTGSMGSTYLGYP